MDINEIIFPGHKDRSHHRRVPSFVVIRAIKNEQLRKTCRR